MATRWMVVLVVFCLDTVTGSLTNIALRKPVWQSSYHDISRFTAENGVDGDVTSFIHTEVKNNRREAVWGVYLEREAQDAMVTVHFRDYNIHRNKGLRLYTSATNFTSNTDGAVCHTVVAQTPLMISVNCTGSWSFLKVYSNTVQPGAGDQGSAVMDFAEVEVLACGVGKYGPSCPLSCDDRNCEGSNSRCNQWTGECVGGCRAGWQGVDCTQECQAGVSYGRNCESSCDARHCLSPSPPCNAQNGSCGVDRCQAGWKGEDCATGCVKGIAYGQNCARNCSNRHCLNPSASCNAQNGSCEADRCQAGWKGEDCFDGCVQGSEYGANCEGECGQRHCYSSSAPCDVLFGSCGADGCQAGWNGTNCLQECLFGVSYGRNCERGCSDRQCLNESATCDGGTGSCGENRCSAGWKDLDCTTECELGSSYGLNCEGSCSGRNCLDVADSCDSQNGSCASGCNTGWQGADCAQFIGVKEEGTEEGVSAAAWVIPLLLVAVGVAIFIFIKRKRLLPDMKGKPDLGNDYVNVGFSKDTVTGRTGGVKLDIEHGDTVSRDTVDDVDEYEEEPQDNVYDNVGKVHGEVKVEDLEATICRLKNAENGFGTEFKGLPFDFQYSYSDSRKPENTPKNKYKGYYPYDNNRVHLSLLPDVPCSDYINASPIDSCNKGNKYIAAQAPNQHTIGDFWRMIWEQRCGRAVMLTGLMEGIRRKCHAYWSDTDTFETDHHTVHVSERKRRGHYTVRQFKVTSKATKESRTVVQYHYTSWPDHGVPDILALVNFIWTIRRTDTGNDGPLLVHCSAGIGRTGTYIAVDSLLDQAREEGVVDVPGYATDMRSQRKGMIQTKEQYECVFECLLEMSKFGNTSMDVENFTTSYSSRGMDSMVDRKTLRDITLMTISEETKDVKDRNRMWVDGRDDFIVRGAHSFMLERGFLVTLAPTTKQEHLLWQLAEDNEVQNVVFLSKSNVYDNKGETKTCDNYTITSIDQTTLTSDLEMTRLQIKREGEEGGATGLNVFQLSSPSRERLSSCLLNIPSLQQLSGETTPTVVVYSKADEKQAYMFCVMCNVIYEIQEERRVDVIGHVRRFLRGSPDLQLTEEDVIELHKVVQNYIEMTDSTKIYANM